MIDLLDEAALDAVSVCDSFNSAFEAQIEVEAHGELVGFNRLVMHVENPSFDIIFAPEYCLVCFRLGCQGESFVCLHRNIP